jgi:hypothetical protein
MAEQEVIKHTKKIYRIWGSKEHTLWHKIKEFVVEVFIIVFAVSLSIWFHNRSEHAHQQEEVERFLLGLKSDLTRDLDEMRSDRESYLKQKATFSYILSIKPGQSFQADSLKKYKQYVFNTTGLNPNNGRFEGFKSSGKIATIENEELQNDIMDFYQEDIVSLLASSNFYVSYKRRLLDFVFANGRNLTDSTNMNAVLMKDEAQNICLILSTPDEVIARYENCINKAKKIIAEIDKEYMKR